MTTNENGEHHEHHGEIWAAASASLTPTTPNSALPWMASVLFMMVVIAGACAPPSSQDPETTDTDDADTDPCEDGLAEASEQCTDGRESMCGDLHVDAAAAEQCDRTELDGQTCMTQGFDGGTLACDDDCTLDTSGCRYLPSAPMHELRLSPVKQFHFRWAAAAGAEHYRLLESAVPGEPFVQLGDDIVGESISISMPLHLRADASYVLRACNSAGCTESEALRAVGSLTEAVGYFKASNTSEDDSLGASVALSADGSTLAVGAYGESSHATGIDGDETDDSAPHAGAVYVFVRDAMGQWSQQAYVKASNTDANDWFGVSVALSDDGNTLAVGAIGEASDTTGIDGSQADDSAPYAGAVYVFERDVTDEWSQQAYVKASNTDADDWFGIDVALSSDGNTLAVGAGEEDGHASHIDGDQADDSALSAGAVYVFVRDATDEWSQQAYVKASNTDSGDGFGRRLALSDDGNTLAIGATGEASDATGIGGNQLDDSTPGAGAVYVLVRDATDEWSQQAYIKASNPDLGDFFGGSVALSGDGRTLAVGAHAEGSDATGIGGNQADDSTSGAGAVYVFVRDSMDRWSQQAYVKASNPGIYDYFGTTVALSNDADTLVVGATNEASNATGIGGSQADDSTTGAGGVYVLVRDPLCQWSQRAYVKAPNTGAYDYFGTSLALSSDADTLAVGASGEASNATGIGGDPTKDSAPGSGAVYLY